MIEILTCLLAVMLATSETQNIVITPETPTQYAEIVTELNLPTKIEQVINDTAEENGLSADLVRAVIWVESRGQIDADNGLCVGLMQLNKNYADTFMTLAGVETITDPVDNIKAGCKWLSNLIEWADGNEDLALMAYNLGQTGALKKWNNGEITNYVTKVQTARGMFCEEN